VKNADQTPYTVFEALLKAASDIKDSITAIQVVYFPLSLEGRVMGVAWSIHVTTFGQ
jgi:hypothetical protein